MLGENDTPFAAIGFEQAHRDGDDMAVIAVRARYDLSVHGDLDLADEQEIVLVDEYEGDPQSTPLLRPSDLTPFKPGTDVTMLAKTYPPDGKKSARWSSGISVGSRKMFVQAVGPRRWVKNGKQWTSTPPQEIGSLPLDYKFAISDRSHGEQSTNEASLNPVGIRLYDQSADQPEFLLPLPQNELPGTEYAHPGEKHDPCGTGPVPPFWRWRQRYAGTYDEEWKENRHPRLPDDFDYLFYQCASAGLVFAPWLNGDETIQLARVLPEGYNIVFDLPGLQPVAHYQWLDDREVKMRLNLDGVHIDVRRDPFTVDITWRGWLPICPQFFKIDLSLFTLGSPGLAGLPRPSLFGLEHEREEIA